MDVLHLRCCGLDAQESSISALHFAARSGTSAETPASFWRDDPDLRELAEWLRQFGVTQIAMESSGVYWKPVWNILERQFTVVLANAQHIKNVPGRRPTRRMRNDCETAAVWSSAAQLCTLRNHPRSTRPDENAGESVPGSFAPQ